MAALGGKQTLALDWRDARIEWPDQPLTERRRGETARRKGCQTPGRKQQAYSLASDRSNVAIA